MLPANEPHPDEEPAHTLMPGEEDSARPAKAPAAPAALAFGGPTLPAEVGDYELVEELGRGGMGVVYKARQKSLGRIVAFKMVLAHLHGGEARERFSQEARSAAALDHPGIVPLFDFGELAGQPYYTMAFIEGDSLSGLVRKGGLLLPTEAARILAAVADAVAYAHSRGILHRDLKPDNILVDRQGNPRITDFGLARRLDGDANLTGTGAVIGTPAYMAPEQAKGQRNLTAAADIYPLGAILHALLAGKPPFAADSVLELLVKAAHEPPVPLRQINPAVPADLERICLKCLEKDPARRYGSAAEVAAELRAWLGASGTVIASVSADTYPVTPVSGPRPQPEATVVTTPAPPRQRRPLAWVAAALVLVAAGAGTAYWLGRRPAAPEHGPVAPELAAVSDVALEGWTKPVRRDFPLAVKLLGGVAERQGVSILGAGSAISFSVESSRDAYVGVWSLQADGSVLQLFPNEFDTDHFVRADRLRVVPGNNRYEILPEPAGRVEFLRVVASTRPWSPAKGRKEGPFVLFRKADVRTWESQQRGLTIRRVAPSAEAPAAALISEAVLPFRVESSR